MRSHPAVLAAEAVAGKDNLRIVLVESSASVGRLAYQRKKLVLMLSAMRHYAESLCAAGYSVDYVRARDFSQGLREHVRKWKSSSFFTMAASSFQTRRLQGELSTTLGVPVTVLPNTQFLVESFTPFPETQSGKRYLMENFYRKMRRHFSVLLEANGDPSGGQWNCDDPKQRTGTSACPFNYLYWNFLLKHEKKLRAQPRLGPAVLGLSRIPAPERRKIEQEAERYLGCLESITGYENGTIKQQLK